MKNIILLVFITALFASCAADKNTTGSDILMEADKISQIDGDLNAEARKSKTIELTESSKLVDSYIEQTGEIDIDVNNPDIFIFEGDFDEPALDAKKK